jgi:hypothetical protein
MMKNISVSSLPHLDTFDICLSTFQISKYFFVNLNQWFFKLWVSDITNRFTKDDKGMNGVTNVQWQWLPVDVKNSEIKLKINLVS